MTTHQEDEVEEAADVVGALHQVEQVRDVVGERQIAGRSRCEAVDLLDDTGRARRRHGVLVKVRQLTKARKQRLVVRRRLR